MDMQPDWKDDDAADAAFSRLFSTLPAVEPSAAFVQNTVRAAWDAREANRRWVRWAAAAAVLVIVSGISMVTMLGAPAWLTPMAAQAGAAAVMMLVGSATAVAEFWAVTVSAGSALARVAVMPQSLALLLATELVGAGALYALYRLLRDDVRVRQSGPLCI